MELCTLCSEPCKDRRIISPRNDANKNVNAFFLEKICPPNFEFSDGLTYYVCRLTCYRKLERALEKYTSFISIAVGRNSSNIEDPGLSLKVGS